MKLNLGCGSKHMAGFVNVDLAINSSGRSPDVEADITKRLPFDDESADEIHSYHVVEHIFRYEVEDVLKDWIRVLKPGGLFVVECPCLDKVIGIFIAAIEENKPVSNQMTLWPLYGDPSHKGPENVHKWCYSIHELTHVLKNLGIKAELKTPQTHIAARDMRLEGRK